MTLNASGWRPEMTERAHHAPATSTGNRALMLEEPLIFEIGSDRTTGVDFPEGDVAHDRLANPGRGCQQRHAVARAGAHLLGRGHRHADAGLERPVLGVGQFGDE